MKLSAPEIITLMEAAKANGITEFKYGNLRFTTFGYVPAAVAAAEALREDQAAQDWATAEPPPPHSESM